MIKKVLAKLTPLEGYTFQSPMQRVLVTMTFIQDPKKKKKTRTSDSTIFMRLSAISSHIFPTQMLFWRFTDSFSHELVVKGVTLEIKKRLSA